MLETAQSRSPATFAVPPMQGLAASARRPMDLRKPEADIKGLNFTQLAGSAVWVAAAPDGTFWVLSTAGLASGDKFIYHYVNGGFVNFPGAATRLAVGPDGTVWALNAAGGIYYLSPGAQYFAGIAGGASELSVAADGSLYVISNQPGSPVGRGIYHYANGTWTQLPGAGVTVAASIDSSTYNNILGASGQINITPGGFYVTNNQGGIFYYNLATGFSQLPGGAIALAPTSSGGLFALGDPGAYQHGIYYNNLVTGQWSSMPGAAVSLATSGNTLFAIGAAGGIYQSVIAQSAPTPNPGGATALTNVNLSSQIGSAWTPYAVANALQFPVQSGYNGAGFTVAIVSPSIYSIADLSTYLSSFQIPATNRTITAEAIDGASNALNSLSSAAGEANLDVQTVAALAPGANIVVYLIPNLTVQSETDAYAQIIAEGRAQVVTSSFAGCEVPGSSAQAGLSAVMAFGASKGIAFLASSGDQGSACFAGNSLSGTPNYVTGVGYPASDPSVIGVGGNETYPITGNTLTSTIAWSDFFFPPATAEGGTGGGVSGQYPLLTAQQGLAGIASTQFRNVPDLAMPAEYDATRNNFHWNAAFGTSWSSPMFAAMLAEVYEYCNTSFINPIGLPYYVLQANHGAFIDVVTGNNAFNLTAGGMSPAYTAGPGYDNVTGAGVPLGMPFAQTLCPGRVPVSQARTAPQALTTTRRAAQAFALNATPQSVGLGDIGRRPAIQTTAVQIVLAPSATLASDESAVSLALTSAGFTISKTFANHMVIDASAPASVVESYFQTEIHGIRQGGTAASYMPVKPVTVPAAIAPYVLTVNIDDVVNALPTGYRSQLLPEVRGL
jgi:subtilase family serine protease